MIIPSTIMTTTQELRDLAPGLLSKEQLDEIADTIDFAQPRGDLNMDEWGSVEGNVCEKNTCGSVGCLSGWALLRYICNSYEKKELVELFGDPNQKYGAHSVDIYDVVRKQTPDFFGIKDIKIDAEAWREGRIHKYGSSYNPINSSMAYAGAAVLGLDIEDACIIFLPENWTTEFWEQEGKQFGLDHYFDECESANSFGQLIRFVKYYNSHKTRR